MIHLPIRIQMKFVLTVDIVHTAEEVDIHTMQYILNSLRCQKYPVYPSYPNTFPYTITYTSKS